MENQPYKPFEGVVSTDPVEVQMKGDMNPSKRGNLARTALAAQNGQPNLPSPAQVDQGLARYEADQAAKTEDLSGRQAAIKAEFASTDQNQESNSAA